MKIEKKDPLIDKLISPLGKCLTPESARRVLALRADPQLAAAMDELATRHTDGQLTVDESAEYGQYVAFVSFVAVLKSKARQLLAVNPEE